MGKSTKKTPHEDTAGKQTQEKMLSIMSHYRGANVDTQDNATTHRSSENYSHYCSLLVATQSSLKILSFSTKLNVVVSCIYKAYSLVLGQQM